MLCPICNAELKERVEEPEITDEELEKELDEIEQKIKYADDKLKNRVADYEKTLREIRKLLASPIVHEEALRDVINELIDDALGEEDVE